MPVGLVCTECGATGGCECLPLARGRVVETVSEASPYVGYWVGTNDSKTFVGKRIYHNGKVQGFATGDALEARGYSSEGEARKELAELGYPSVKIERHRGQLDLFK